MLISMKKLKPSLSRHAVILPLFMLLGLIALPSHAYEMEVTEQELQQQLDNITLKREDMLLSVEVTDARVNLIEATNRVALKGNIKTLLLGSLQGNGQTEIEGTIQYNSDKAAFYFVDAVIKELKIDKVDPEHLPVIQSALQKAMQEGLARKPIYVLDDNDMKQKLAKATLNHVTVKGKSLIFDFSLF